MLTSETKNKLNSVKNVLVGKIPDPKGQVDQITNALIYKFMDDQDRLSMSVPGGKASFFVGELEEYAWHKLFDSKLSNQDRADLYIKGLDKLSTATKLPELFRDIFKNAYLPFRAPDTIAMFLDVINTFDYHHPEELGNAFEHLLSIMGSQGDAGQFRTPRHIIEFIVKIVSPKKDETIFDPACGTAGFLVEAFNQIKNSSKLTPQELQLLANNIEGFDIDPGMAKLARVNLYLHGFKTPHITENDTLTNENLWLKKKYDVILANPPFMSPKGGIKPHDKFSVKANKSEVLFVNYIAEHLKLHGRAGIIVPEGIIFQSGNAYKQLRRTLVEDGYLSAIVSLPSGVFNPYAGVKTSILILDRERAKNSKEILFVKVENDGYDLGAQRRPISKNDLPEAFDVLEKWKSGKKVESKISSFVSKEKIAESGDYNLSGDRYVIATDYSNAKWPMFKIEDVVSTITPPIKILKENFKVSGNFPIIDQSQNEIAGWTDDDSALIKSDKPLVIFGDHTCAIKYFDKAFAQGADGIKILLTVNDLLPKYLYYVLKTKPVESDGYQRHFSKLKRYAFPLPPLEIQEQIVAELDSYQKIIDGAKQVIGNWKPKIEIDQTWKKVKLPEIAEYSIGLTYTPEEVSDKGIIVLRSSNIQDNELDFSDIVRVNKKIKESLIVKNGDILMCSRNGSKRLVGKTVLIESFTEEMTFGTFMTIIRSKYNRYLSYFFVSDVFRGQLDNSETSSINQITKYMLDEIVVPFPSVEIQKQIVEKIEAEKLLVESNKKLIEIYEQKMKDVISKLWN